MWSKVRRSDFKDLQIWLKGKELYKDLYRFTKSFPEDEKFGMTSQIRRAALSISTNIAEGHARSSNADFTRFLYMSLGSIRELETLLELANEVEMCGPVEDLIARLQEVGRMIISYIKYLQSE